MGNEKDFVPMHIQEQARLAMQVEPLVHGTSAFTYVGIDRVVSMEESRTLQPYLGKEV